jgi:2-polyprenyl-3-methyl-5-hydroxy-6-metoxy-1,4-benzoquinol methylase
MTNTTFSEYYKIKPSGYYDGARLDVLPFLPDDIKTVLDVGCSNGSTGLWLKENRSCVVHGVEPHEESSKQAQRKLDLVIHSDFHPNLPLQKGYYDCVLFLDVLEHMFDPRPAIEQAHELLTPGGYLICSLPNLRYFPCMVELLYHKDFQYQNSGVQDFTHLKFYTKKSIVRLFDEKKFQIKSYFGINSLQTMNPYYWKKFRPFRFFLRRFVEDMEYQQYLAILKKY